MEKLGFLSSVFIGIGAIVGGGIFVLGGVAIAESGPGAIVAFCLNGAMALITAYSFARLARAFPESGGAYLYGKRILSLRAGFVVGWMLLLAHLVTALLYAFGFAAYLGSILNRISSELLSTTTNLFNSQLAGFILGGAGVVGVSLTALRKSHSEGVLSNVLKVSLLVLIIACGLVVALTDPAAVHAQNFKPFLPAGFGSVFVTMGYTFIALQGFELIAASTGEIKDATKNVPKAMYVSILVALGVYIPLLIVVIALGIPQEAKPSLWCQARLETCVAEAVEVFLGSFGYWMVAIAALFATLSALTANVYAASKLANTMGKDRSLPRIFARLHSEYNTPEVAISVNCVLLLILLASLPDVAAAGAAASLAFLISYSLAHGLAIVNLFRSNGGISRTSLLKKCTLPLLGFVACIALSIFQIWVEEAGIIVLVCWVLIGALLYYLFLSERAEALDAFYTAQDPLLLLHRGIAPIALVPIKNPERANALAALAHAVVPHKIGRILLLTVAEPDNGNSEQGIKSASSLIADAISVTIKGGRERVEGIVSLNKDPWLGIKEIAEMYRCETVLMGFSGGNMSLFPEPLVMLMRSLAVNVIVLNSPAGWRLEQVTRVLVPLAGRGVHDRLRARIIGSLTLNPTIEEIVFYRMLSSNTSRHSVERVKRGLEHRAIDEASSGKGRALVEIGDNPEEGIFRNATAGTLVVLGVGLGEAAKRGSLASKIAARHVGATLIISRGGSFRS